MSVIWKTVLAHEKTQVVSLPSTWRPLKFDNQRGFPVIWYEADPESGVTDRVIYTVFTGEAVPPKARYIGTAAFGLGHDFIVHCYVG